MRTRKASYGFTIIELMIAMVIGLILLAGVYQLMISSKRTYNLQSDLARMQEGARFALDFIADDLRMVGYFGCSGELGQILSGPASLGMEGGNFNQNALFGSDNTGLNGSDIVRVAYMDSNPNAFAVTHCTRDLNNNGLLDNEAGGGDCQPRMIGANLNPNFPTVTPLATGNTSFSSPGMIENGERIIATDCGGSNLYSITAANTPAGGNTTVTITPGLFKDYNNGGQSYGAELRRFVEARYFIAQNNRGGVSLFKQHFLGNALRTAHPNESVLPATTGQNLPAGVEEVIEGVENMQLRYNENIDSNNDGTLDQFQYRTAANVTNWDNVRGVMLTLLMRTMQERFDMDMNTDTYQLDPGDAAYDPVDDHRERRVFSTTVMVRNN